MQGRHPSAVTMQAEATYEIDKAEARAKGIPHSVTLTIIERRYKLKPGTLTSWRNNQFAPCKSQERRHAYYERKKHETRTERS